MFVKYYVVAGKLRMRKRLARANNCIIKVNVASVMMKTGIS